MPRLLSEDAGLGAFVEMRYDHPKRARKAFAKTRMLATGIAKTAVALIAHLR